MRTTKFAALSVSHRRGITTTLPFRELFPDPGLMQVTTHFSERNASTFFQIELKRKVKGIPEFGDVCLGYFSDTEIAGAEFFFPLQRVEALKGKCPVFAQVIQGAEELHRIEKVETYPNPYEPVEINVPRNPEIMVTVEVETFGVDYPEPEKIIPEKMPENWPTFA